MNLSLGPLLYYWSRDDALAFYDEASKWPVARVYLGESVCSRRHLLRLWLAPRQARELPPVYAQRYGDITPGNRGGIVVKDTVLRFTLEPA